MDFEICISVAYFEPEKQTHSSKFLDRNATALKKEESKKFNPAVEVRAHLSVYYIAAACTLRFGIF